MVILVTAEMPGTPGRVANSIKSVWSVHLILTNKGNEMHALQRGRFKFVQERMACACEYNLLLKGSTCNLEWPRKPISTDNLQAFAIRGVTGISIYWL